MRFIDSSVGEDVANEMLSIMQRKNIFKAASKECKCDASCSCKKDGSCVCEMSCPDFCKCEKATEASVKNIATELLVLSSKLEGHNLNKAAANFLTLANVLMAEAQDHEIHEEIPPPSSGDMDMPDSDLVVTEPEDLEKKPEVLVSNESLDEKMLELDSLERKLNELDELGNTSIEPAKNTEEEKFQEIMRDWSKLDNEA